MSSEVNLFSIIVPTYNHAHLIGRCIQSVIDQTLPNWEMIIINNFSSDSTKQVVEGFRDQRITIMDFANNGIIAASRNAGIRMANGNLIAFLDSDDWWYPEKLERVVEAIKFADVVFHPLDIWTPKGSKFRKTRCRELSHPVFLDLLINGNCIPNSSVVVKRELLDDSALFSENQEIVTAEDYDLWLRLATKTERFIFISQSLGAYWINGQNQSANVKNSWRSLTHVVAKHSIGISSENLRQVSATLDYIACSYMLRSRCADMREIKLSAFFGLKSIGRKVVYLIRFILWKVLTTRLKYRAERLV